VLDLKAMNGRKIDDLLPAQIDDVLAKLATLLG
jgi:hypothetical protein